MHKTMPSALTLLAVCTHTLAATSPAQPQPENYFDSNWWLVYLTAALSLFTLGLVIYTARMWNATVQLSKDAQKNADQQRRDTDRALAAAEKSALAAEMSASTATESLVKTQRAFVFINGLSAGPNIFNNKPTEYFIWCDVVNVGNTPAMDSSLNIKFKTSPPNSLEPPFFDADKFNHNNIALGPRATYKSPYLVIPINVLIDCWHNKVDLHIWCYLSYKDIFNPDVVHHHEQCAKVVLIHEPSTIPPQGHPPYLTFIAVGPQNSAS